MDPMPGALEAVDALKEKYDLYILASSPWENPTALGDKLAWVKQYFGGDGPENIFFRPGVLLSLLAGTFISVLSSFLTGNQCWTSCSSG